MKTTFFTLILTQLLTLSAHAGSWNGSNDPSLFDDHYEYHLSALPVKGTLATLPWSETYWPSDHGSINYRWNSSNPVGFDYVSPTRAEVMQMSKDQLAQLSPSEKYDLAMGRYDYPLKTEVMGSASKHAPSWAGICNGWSPMALQLPEPKAVEITNPDGIVIPFGSSDVKGLLSYYAAFYADLDVSQIGTRCNKIGEILNLPGCQDVNAGAFHVTLANEIGIKGKGFVADVDPGNQVWNQPIYGFEFELTGSTFSTHGKSAVTVHAKMFYTDELEKSLWTPVVGTPQFSSNSREMDYVLELDNDGKITGGEWINHSSHPDFLWKANKDVTFTGDFEGLNRIYQPVTKN